MKKIHVTLCVFLLTGCSALTQLGASAVLGSATKGMDVTAQVGKENSKGFVNAKLDRSKALEFDDVRGNALVDSGNTVNNDALTMIGLVFAGAFFPMLILFYMLPSPRWLDKRHKEQS